MHRTLVFRSLGIAVAAVVTLSIGYRPPIQARQNPSVVASEVVGGAFGGGGGNDELAQAPVVHLPAKPMSPEATRVWLKLQDRLAMPFPNETPLEDVVKYIQESTREKDVFPEGIPVYVDPVGLQDADKTMASTIAINLKGIPLATSLELLLKQLGLTYRIHKDGMVFITSSASEDSPPDAEALILDNLSALRAEVKALREELRAQRSGPPSGPIESKPAGGMGSRGGMM